MNLEMKIKECFSLGQCARVFEHNIPKCTSILQNETISKERFCGDKDDLLYCWSRGILKCCYNNIPCLELESTLAMTVDFVYDVIVAEAEYDEKEEEERKRRDEKRRRHKGTISIIIKSS